jgi:hypothetical protein
VKLCAVLAAAIVVIVGFGEGIPWIIGTFAVLVGLGAVVLVAGSTTSAAPVFHGHGDTRQRAVTHERRHKRVLNGLGIRVARIKVWEDPNWGWEGVTEIDKSAANLARWNALSPAQQAAVYIAGSPSLGRRKDFGCSDDMAAVDARASRGAARRIARKYV